MEQVDEMRNGTELKIGGLRKISDSTTDSIPCVDNESLDECALCLNVANNCSGALFTRPMSMDFPISCTNESNKSHTEVIIRSKSTPSLYKLSLNDFKVKKLLGTGGYSKVILAEHIESKDNYAIKILEKDFLVKVSFKVIT